MIKNLFLCVGAQKSGTTWLYVQLDDHPDIAFADVKEIHYFNTIHNGSILLSARKVEHLKRLINNNKGALERYFTNLSMGRKVDPNIKKLLSSVDDNWYMELFKNNIKKYAADFSPEYALLPKEGLENVKRVSQNQKIIFLMRDPVARTKSAIQYFFQTQGIEPDQINEEMIWDVSKKDFIVNLSKYEHTIRLLKSEFKENQLKFMFFEEIMADKQTAIDEICEFLDIKKVKLVEDKAEEKVNFSKKIKFPEELENELKSQLINTYRFMYENFQSVPDNWMII